VITSFGGVAIPQQQHALNTLFVIAFSFTLLIISTCRTFFFQLGRHFYLVQTVAANFKSREIEQLVD
jgi:hypothetical protein